MMKFLIVDDERDVEMLFRQKIRKEIRKGLVELEFAFSGNDALEKINSQKPPEYVYIFSDINMPGMSGLELLENVKENFPGISVSIISDYGDEDNYKKAIQSGAKEFLTKPIDFNSLKEEIMNVVDENQAQLRK